MLPKEFMQIRKFRRNNKKQKTRYFGISDGKRQVIYEQVRESVIGGVAMCFSGILNFFCIKKWVQALILR